MKLAKLAVNIAMCATVLTTTVVPTTLMSAHQVSAETETIYGIPISDFDALTNASKRHEEVLNNYNSFSGLGGYDIKFKLDAYNYMYQILLIAEKLGENQVDVIRDNVLKYNRSIRSPLTEEDEIKISPGKGELFKIESTSKQAENKIKGLMGTKKDADDIKDVPLTYMGQLMKLRVDLGYTKDLGVDSSSLSEEKQTNFLKTNISEVRLLLTSTKEYLVDFTKILDNTKEEELQKLFIDTYNKVINVSVKADIQGLMDLNLYGEITTEDINAGDENAHLYIGNYEDEKEPSKGFESLSDLMLKNIAISSTFKPFETSLNSTTPFEVVGQQNSQFHSVFGTKRKMLLTPIDSDNTLDKGLNIETTKKLKYATLRGFIEKPKTPKILYVDNMAYELEDIEREQQVITGEDTEADKDEDGEDEEDKNNTNVGEQTFVDNDSGIVNIIKKKYINPLIEFFVENPFNGGDVELINNLVFASGDLTKVNRLVGKMKDKRNDINESFLILNNIIEEYYTPTTKLTLMKDLDKPLFIDIYGNIITASGIVVIPAVSNPYYYGDSYPSFSFNRAFIESYPQFVAKKGDMVVSKSDKKKYVIGTEVLNSNQESEQKDKLSEAKTLEEDDYIPGVGFFIKQADGPISSKKMTMMNDYRPVVKKFDKNYQPVVAMNLWSHYGLSFKDGDNYEDLQEKLKDLSESSRKLLIREFTAEVNTGETNEIVSFLEVPDDDTIRKFLYITNLEYIASISDNQINDRGVLDRDYLYKTITEVYHNGTYDIEKINSLVPDVIQKVYDKYVEFLLGMANNRYESVLGKDIKNNILYAPSIEEISVLQNMLPIVYKIILLIALSSIIIYIIATIVSSDGRFKMITKVLTVLYLVTFLFNMSSWVLDTLINKPTRTMFEQETAFWTIIEQEKNTHLREMKTDTEIEDTEPENGSLINLYKIPWDYPYQLIRVNGYGNITLEEFYEHYLKDDSRFQAQNNEMFVSGNYLATRTKTLFDSSAVVVENEKDLRKKLVHEIYYDPELAYYLPYYLIVDNLVYNLNLVSEINYMIPYDIAYSSGIKKSTGRIDSWLNSKMFLDYDEFMKDVEGYTSGDAVDEELDEGKIKSIVDSYGSPDDFLGLSKLFGVKDNIAPFTEEGIEAVSKTGWYPTMSPDFIKRDYDDIEKRILKVNRNVKKFMLELSEVAGKVADEHLIKTIALYASLEFNKEFTKYNGNKDPVALELNDVPIERILMSLSIPREDLLKNSVTSYQNYVVESTGYWGLLLSSINDLVIVFINYVKPVLMVLIWTLTGAIIFAKKIVIPDPKNRSIIGSLKLLFFYVLSSNLYSLCLIGVIKAVNSGTDLIVGQLLLLLASLCYMVAIFYLFYAMTKDSMNLGSSVMFKGLENLTKTLRQSMEGVVKSNPLLDKYFGGKYPVSEPVRHLEQYFEQHSIKYADEIGNAPITSPINFNMKELSDKVSRRNPFNRESRNEDDGYDRVELPSDRFEKRGGEYVPTSVNYEEAYSKQMEYQEQSNMLFEEYVSQKRQEEIKEETARTNSIINENNYIELEDYRRNRRATRQDEPDDDYLRNNRDTTN